MTATPLIIRDFYNISILPSTYHFIPEIMGISIDLSQPEIPSLAYQYDPEPRAGIPPCDR
jgi:hypothetical protein